MLPTQAALTFSLAYLAAIVAILVLARMLDAFGPKATVFTAAGGIAAFLYLGTPGLSGTAITLCAILAMACSSSTHQALNGIVGGFYPTIIRGNGVGYASGMGRAAAIIGPAIAGYLLSAQLPLQEVLAVIVSPYVVVIGVCLALSRLKNRISAQLAEAERTEAVGRMDRRDVDIGPPLENQRVGRFQLLTLTLGCLVLFVDGLDYSAVNVGAPSILRAFGAERSAMGFVFGWGYFGIFVGSVLFGIIGDRYGRKPGLVLGVLAYSLPALFTLFATSLDELTVFRFLAGIGIGGVVPNTIALLTETAPKRYRVTFVMIAFVGYSTGNASIAQVAARFIPAYGWSIVFLVAGSLGIALSLVLALALP